MNPILTMTMKNGQVIKMELDPSAATQGVNGLLWLLDRKGYDGIAISRLVPDFVLQPWFDESKMPEMYQYIQEGEFSSMGHPEADRPFEKYSIGLAGDGGHIQCCGCFFIVVGDNCQERLNGKFAYVGKVISGFEEIERIMHVEMTPMTGMGAQVNVPVTPEIIESITVDYNGYKVENLVQYGELKM